LGVGDELERAAELADKIADQPPRAPSGRHDDWCHGWQDGAMEVAAAIREMIEARHRQITCPPPCDNGKLWHNIDTHDLRLPRYATWCPCCMGTGEASGG
jgi:hypothetical protein